jgi:hypothetical protein
MIGYLQNLYNLCYLLIIMSVPDECYWVGLWCLMPLSTIFQLYRSSQFYWWRQPEYVYPEKTTDHKSLTNFKLITLLYQVHLTISGI